MSDQSQRTEQPTPQKLKKAREKGDFPTAPQLVSSVQFVAFVILSAAHLPGWMDGLQVAIRSAIKRAFASSLTPEDVFVLMRSLMSAAFGPLMVLGGGLLAITFFLQMVATNMGFSLARLSPKLDRLNPANKLKEMPSNNMAQLLQAVITIPIMFWMTWSLVRAHLPEIMHLPMLPVASASASAGLLMKDALKKASYFLVLVGVVMAARDRSRYNARMRMSKQEIRDESKENEGNPQLKARARRMQRDMRKKNMMLEVPKATAIIVNPTHYAVAIRYEPGTMTAPEILAKGRNYLAARIRKLANEHQIPIIENPPLAQALYKSVEVGQQIPPHLYRAVAEILAYIFRIMGNTGRK